MNIEEEFVMHGQDPQLIGSGIPWATYDIKTTNDMLGGQIGGVLALNPHTRIRLEFTGKAAFMANMTDKTDSLDVVEVRPDLLRSSTDSTKFAFVGDLSARISGKIHKNIWLTAGYNTLFVQGIALAHEQADWSETRTQSHKIKTGDAIYHGFNAGLTIRW
jgi:hypothetical protein